MSLSPDAKFFIAHTTCLSLSEYEYIIAGETAGTGSFFYFAYNSYVSLSQLRAGGILIGSNNYNGIGSSKYRAYTIRL